MSDVSLAVKEYMSSIHSEMASIRSLVNFLTSFIKHREMFEMVCIELGMAPQI